jgi:hypothetical protein
MEKILGKYYIFFFILIHLHVQTYINLDITAFNGRKITEAAAGEVFVVKVSTDETDDVSQMMIDGLEHVNAQKTGVSIISVNGNKTAQVSYQVRIDQPGTYTFGPAYMPDGASVSDKITMSIKAAPLDAGGIAKKNNSAEQVLLQMEVDRDTAYVGQRINTVLRAYFPEAANITLDHVTSNDPATVETTAKDAPTRTMQTVNGVRYLVLEWQWQMYPKQAGQLIIPAYFVDYARALPMQHGFGGLSMFFGPQYERQRTYSNALTIDVLPLPASDTPADAVGSFISYTAALAPATSKQYEGVVLTLTLEGEGNMDAVEDPELRHMPEGLKHYFSKSVITQGATDLQKSFEYIVQGMQAGEWQIPSQTFTFFDPNTGVYKQLQTEALAMTVLADTPKASLVSAEESVSEQEQQCVAPLCITHADSLPMSGALSLIQLLLSMFLPLLLYALYKIASSQLLLSYIAPNYLKRQYYATARKELTRAGKQRDVQAVYGIFMRLFKHQNTSAETFYEQHSWPAIKIEAWNTFFESITQAAYAHARSANDRGRLFHDAECWLDELERIL